MNTSWSMPRLVRTSRYAVSFSLISSTETATSNTMPGIPRVLSVVTRHHTRLPRSLSPLASSTAASISVPSTCFTRTYSPWTRQGAVSFITSPSTTSVTPLTAQNASAESSSGRRISETSVEVAGIDKDEFSRVGDAVVIGSATGWAPVACQSRPAGLSSFWTSSSSSSVDTTSHVMVLSDPILLLGSAYLYDGLAMLPFFEPPRFSTPPCAKGSSAIRPPLASRGRPTPLGPTELFVALVFTAFWICSMSSPRY
mmetsp:Transcript_11666/g.32896  ORF Transcript_11666/g.32896 Transcript_11666/m.32896 type:complete len:255 (+) Transcript_11666:379-1143(+)